MDELGKELDKDLITIRSPVGGEEGKIKERRQIGRGGSEDAYRESGKDL